MINYIWFLLITISIIISFFNGNIYEVNNMILQSAIDSIELSIKLLGPMILWLGMMNIIKKAGITDLLGKLLKPIIKLLFPEISSDSSAAGAILLNLSSNILGLGNAATPLGINAMKELQKVNNEKKTASPAMCTLLALNTSSLTIIPTTIISLRIASGSSMATVIVVTTIFATSVSTITAIIFDKFFRYLTRK